MKRLAKVVSSNIKMQVRQLAIFAVLFGISCMVLGADGKPPFSFELQDDRLIISHSTKPILHYVFRDDRIRRPYFAHVRTLDGIQVSRRHPPVSGEDATDHDTMHPGIWIAFGDISDEDFWRNKGTIRHERFDLGPVLANNELTFATENTLLSSVSQPMARLVNRISFSAQPEGYLLVWDASFTPTMENFYFGDQEEMGFGVRVATAIIEKNGGTISNSSGLKGAKATWGKTAAWCDYSGVIDGRRVGVAVMPDPKNFRLSWFHNRDYGLMAANPFGQNAFTKGPKSKVGIARGETFRIRWGVFIHSSSETDSPGLERIYRDFLMALR
ncbi:MAG: PmoA family protein [Verrucomicrobia bacterium]|nr:PmoA family protein [Verrucomicrobiota bacterium]